MNFKNIYIGRFLCWLIDIYVFSVEGGWQRQVKTISKALIIGQFAVKVNSSLF